MDRIFYRELRRQEETSFPATLEELSQLFDDHLAKPIRCYPSREVVADRALLLRKEAKAWGMPGNAQIRCFNDAGAFDHTATGPSAIHPPGKPAPPDQLRIYSDSTTNRRTYVVASWKPNEQPTSDRPYNHVAYTLPDRQVVRIANFQKGGQLADTLEAGKPVSLAWSDGLLSNADYAPISGDFHLREYVSCHPGDKAYGVLLGSRRNVERLADPAVIEARLQERGYVTPPWLAPQVPAKNPGRWLQTAAFLRQPTNREAAPLVGAYFSLITTENRRVPFHHAQEAGLLRELS